MEYEEEVEHWLAVRKEASLKIDPSTAKVMFERGYILDPYGVENLPDEYRVVGKNWFARAPDSDVWVSFHDLPEEICKALAHIETDDYDDFPF